MIGATSATVAVGDSTATVAGDLNRTGVTAADDAYTVDSLPGRETGDFLKIAVGTANGDRKRGYLRFLAGPAPEGSTVELVLDVIGGDGGLIEVRQTATDWQEETLTAGNAPSLGVVLGSARAPVGDGRVVVKLGTHNRTGGVWSFALVRNATTTGIVRFSSEEDDAGGDPLLRVADSASTPSPECKVSRKLVPSCGAWFGVSAVPLGNETYEDAFDDFERQAQRPMDIVHYYATGQRTMFPTREMRARANEPGRNRLLFVNWRPIGLTWRQVANGAADDYLRDLATHIRTTFPEPFFLSINAEMEDEVRTDPDSGKTASDFRAFFRHVVSMLRANGADNVVTSVVYVGAPHWGDKPWFETLYPGDDVVDWIGEDPYAFGKPPIWLSDYAGMVNRNQNPAWSTWPGFYSWARNEHPGKPVMLAEWGVDESSQYPGFKANFFREAPSQLDDFPAIKALVYWNAPDAGVVGTTRIDSSAGSLAAFREFAASPYLTRAGAAHLR